MAFFIKNKLQDSIKAFGIYVENELDRFSAVIMTMSLLWGISFILNPNQLELEQTPYRLLQIMINFFLTGSFAVFGVSTLSSYWQRAGISEGKPTNADEP